MISVTEHEYVSMNTHNTHVVGWVHAIAYSLSLWSSEYDPLPAWSRSCSQRRHQGNTDIVSMQVWLLYSTDKYGNLFILWCCYRVSSISEVLSTCYTYDMINIYKVLLPLCDQEARLSKIVQTSSKIAQIAHIVQNSHTPLTTICIWQVRVPKRLLSSVIYG